MRRSTMKKYHRVKCCKCGKEISKSNIRKHEKKCKKVSIVVPESRVNENQEDPSTVSSPGEHLVRMDAPGNLDSVGSHSVGSQREQKPNETSLAGGRLSSLREQVNSKENACSGEYSSEKLIKRVSHAYKMRFQLFLEKKCDVDWLKESSKEYHRSLYEKIIENGGNRQDYYRILKSSSLGWGSLEIRLLKLFTYKMRTCAGSWIQKNYRDEALDYLLKLQECIVASEGFSHEKLCSTWSGPNMAIFGPIELMQCTSVRFSQVCRSRVGQSELQNPPVETSGYVRLRDSGLLSHGVWVEDRGWRKTLKNLCDHAFRAAREELRALLGEILVTKEPPEQKSKFVKWFQKTWVGKDFQYQDEVINLFECLYYFNEVDQSGDPLFFSLFINKMNLTWVIPIADKDKILYAPKTHKDSVPLADEVSKEENSNLGFATWTDFFCTQGSSFHQRNTFQWFMECYEEHRGERAVVLKLGTKKNITN